MQPLFQVVQSLRKLLGVYMMLVFGETGSEQAKCFNDDRIVLPVGIEDFK